MIDYVSISATSKSKISIHKKAFIEIVNSIPKTINDIQIINNKTNAMISLDGKSVKLYLEIKIAQGIKINDKILEIKKSLENHCSYLIDSKPTNIIINYIGRI